MSQIRLSTADLAEFNGKTELNAMFILNHFIQLPNSQILMRFSLK